MASNLDIQKFVPLKTVVSMFLDAHDKGMGDYDKMWILSFRALAKLNQQFAALPKSLMLPVNGNKTVDFPSDYITWSKIGIMTDHGQFVSIKINNALSTLRDSNPNRLNYLTPEVNSSLGLLGAAPFFFNYYGNGVYNMSPLFGYGGGLIQYGEAKVDEENKVIILPPDFKYASVLLEYISAPERDGDYVVETVLQEPIIAFLEWKTGLGSRQEFYGCCVEARRTMPNKRVTLQNINQIVRETSGGYLKA